MSADYVPVRRRQILWAQVYVLKNFTSLMLVNLVRLLDKLIVKIGVIFVSGLKDEKLIKQTNLHETWNM